MLVDITKKEGLMKNLAANSVYSEFEANVEKIRVATFNVHKPYMENPFPTNLVVSKEDVQLIFRTVGELSSVIVPAFLTKKHVMKLMEEKKVEVEKRFGKKYAVLDRCIFTENHKQRLFFWMGEDKKLVAEMSGQSFAIQTEFHETDNFAARVLSARITDYSQVGENKEHSFIFFPSLICTFADNEEQGIVSITKKIVISDDEAFHVDTPHLAEEFAAQPQIQSRFEDLFSQMDKNPMAGPERIITTVQNIRKYAGIPDVVENFQVDPEEFKDKIESLRDTNKVFYLDYETQMNDILNKVVDAIHLDIPPVLTFYEKSIMEYVMKNSAEIE
jgi:hypothetical protein